MGAVWDRTRPRHTTPRPPRTHAAIAATTALAAALLILASCGEVRVKVNSPHDKEDPMMPGTGSDGDQRPGMTRRQ